MHGTVEPCTAGPVLGAFAWFWMGLLSNPVRLARFWMDGTVEPVGPMVTRLTGLSNPDGQRTLMRGKPGAADAKI